MLIDGRAWRRSDPRIPAAFRQELVNELMSARRAVQTALRSTDPEAERAARSRVQDAKLALGERGAAWWETPTEAQLQTRIEATVRALLRHRGTDKTICPSDVARTVGGPGWRALMQPVRDVSAQLAALGT
ncbi:MAG: hypothetical protein JWN48_5986, partial [Myxococcaceae bacterium]|nr:hypothetical protein [Myxococcaceae bacterium]